MVKEIYTVIGILYSVAIEVKILVYGILALSEEDVVYKIYSIVGVYVAVTVYVTANESYVSAIVTIPVSVTVIYVIYYYVDYAAKLTDVPVSACIAEIVLGIRVRCYSLIFTFVTGCITYAVIVMCTAYGVAAIDTYLIVVFAVYDNKLGYRVIAKDDLDIPRMYVDLYLLVVDLCCESTAYGSRGYGSLGSEGEGVYYGVYIGCNTECGNRSVGIALNVLYGCFYSPACAYKLEVVGIELGYKCKCVCKIAVLYSKSEYYVSVYYCVGNLGLYSCAGCLKCGDSLGFHDCVTLYASLYSKTGGGVRGLVYYYPSARGMRTLIVCVSAEPCDHFCKIVEDSGLCSCLTDVVKGKKEVTVLILEVYTDGSIVAVAPDTVCVLAESEDVDPIGVKTCVLDIVSIGEIGNVGCILNVSTGTCDATTPHVTFLSKVDSYLIEYRALVVVKEQAVLVDEVGTVVGYDILDLEIHTVLGMIALSYVVDELIAASCTDAVVVMMSESIYLDVLGDTAYKTRTNLKSILGTGRLGYYSALIPSVSCRDDLGFNKTTIGTGACDKTVGGTGCQDSGFL